jgi:signal transduction histidine kinase
MGYIKVTDDGQGIPPAVAGRVFDRFYQGDPSRSASGTGLGLAIVRAIAEALHGTAEVATPAQGGASIVVRIPLAPSENRSGQAVGPPAPERSPQLH